MGSYGMASKEARRAVSTEAISFGESAFPDSCEPLPSGAEAQQRGDRGPSRLRDAASDALDAVVHFGPRLGQIRKARAGRPRAAPIFMLVMLRCQNLLVAVIVRVHRIGVGLSYHWDDEARKRRWGKCCVAALGGLVSLRDVQAESSSASLAAVGDSVAGSSLSKRKLSGSARKLSTAMAKVW